MEARGSLHTTAAAHAVAAVTVQPTGTAMRIALASLGACADLQPWAMATASAAANLRALASSQAQGLRHIGAAASIQVGAEGRAAAQRNAFTWAHASGSSVLQASATQVHGARASVWAVAQLLAAGHVVAGGAAQPAARTRLRPTTLRRRTATAEAGTGAGIQAEAQTNASAQDHASHTFTRPARVREFSRPGRGGREYLRPAVEREFWRPARIEFKRTP